MLRSYQAQRPRIARSAYIDASALVIGDVQIGADSSIWPMCVVRGDVHSIRIGERTNIQDACVLHVSSDSEFLPGGLPLVVGNDVTVGHRVILHACEVGDGCLIGMASTIMDGAVLEAGLMIGAGSLVPTGKHLEGGYLYLGSPVRRVRELQTREREYLAFSALHYARLKDRHLRTSHSVHSAARPQDK